MNDSEPKKQTPNYPKLEPMQQTGLTHNAQELAKNPLPPIGGVSEETGQLKSALERNPVTSGEGLPLGQPIQPLDIQTLNAPRQQGDGKYQAKVLCCSKRNLSATEFIKVYFQNQFYLILILIVTAALQVALAFLGDSSEREEELGFGEEEDDGDRRGGRLLFLIFGIATLAILVFLILWFIDAWVYYCRIKRADARAMKQTKCINLVGNWLFLVLTVLECIFYVFSFFRGIKGGRGGDRDGDDDAPESPGDDEDDVEDVGEGDEDDEEFRAVRRMLSRVLESPPRRRGRDGDGKRGGKADIGLVIFSVVLFIVNALFAWALFSQIRLRKQVEEAKRSLSTDTNQVAPAKQLDQIDYQ